MKTIGIQFEGCIALPKKAMDGTTPIKQVPINGWEFKKDCLHPIELLMRNPNYCPIVVTFRALKDVSEYIKTKMKIQTEPYVEGMMRSNNTLYLCNLPFPFDAYVVSRGTVINVNKGGWSNAFSEATS